MVCQLEGKGRHHMLMVTVRSNPARDGCVGKVSRSVSAGWRWHLLVGGGSCLGGSWALSCDRHTDLPPARTRSSAYPLFFEAAGEELEKELESVPDLLESLLELQDGRGAAGAPRASEPSPGPPGFGNAGQNPRMPSDERGRAMRSSAPGWIGRESWEGGPRPPRGGGGARSGEPRRARRDHPPSRADPSPGRWLGAVDDPLWGEAAESPLAHGGGTHAREQGMRPAPDELRWGATAKARSRRVQRSSRELWPSCLAPLSPGPPAAAAAGGPSQMTLSALGALWKPTSPPPARAPQNGVPLRGDAGSGKAAFRQDSARPALLEWKRSQGGRVPHLAASSTSGGANGGLAASSGSRGSSGLLPPLANPGPDPKPRDRASGGGVRSGLRRVGNGGGGLQPIRMARASALKPAGGSGHGSGGQGRVPTEGSWSCVQGAGWAWVASFPALRQQCSTASVSCLASACSCIYARASSQQQLHTWKGMLAAS